MLEMPESWNTCRGKLLTGEGTSPRERSVLLSRKLNGVGDLKRALTPDLEMQSLESVQLVLDLIWPSIFSLCSPSALLEW